MKHNLENLLSARTWAEVFYLLAIPTLASAILGWVAAPYFLNGSEVYSDIIVGFITFDDLFKAGDYHWLITVILSWLFFFLLTRKAQILWSKKPLNEKVGRSFAYLRVPVVFLGLVLGGYLIELNGAEFSYDIMVVALLLYFIYLFAKPARPTPSRRVDDAILALLPVVALFTGAAVICALSFFSQGQIPSHPQWAAQLTIGGSFLFMALGVLYREMVWPFYKASIAKIFLILQIPIPLLLLRFAHYGYAVENNTIDLRMSVVGLAVISIAIMAMFFFNHTFSDSVMAA